MDGCITWTPKELLSQQEYFLDGIPREVLGRFYSLEGGENQTVLPAVKRINQFTSQKRKERKDVHGKGFLSYQRE